jgi:hypothetical protein
MRLSFKRVLVLFAIACCFVGLGYSAIYGLDVYRQATQHEVGLESGPGYPGMNDGPITVLQSALPKNRLAAKFRVKWSDVHPGLMLEGWMLYDRRQSTLEVYDYGCSTDDGDKPSCSKSTYLYDNVNDKLLTNLPPSTDTATLPRTMAKLGCRIHKMR